MQIGPYQIKLEKNKKYHWCSCGFSSMEPFCDGAHKSSKSSKKSVHFEAAETKKYFLCSCKNTKTPPFCDGSHSKI